PGSGVTSYSGLQITYTNSGSNNENFNLQATSGGLTAATSNAILGRIPDNDGSVTASATITEPVAIATTLDTSGEALAIYDFVINDGSTADGTNLSVSAIRINTSGTVDASKLSYLLNGPGAVNVAGTYATNVITFSALSIVVADGGNETYTLSAYYNDNTGLTEGQTLILSLDGDTDIDEGATGTQIGVTTPLTNDTGSTVDVTATALAVTTQPAGSVSGIALTTQAVVAAHDAFGNTDADFIGTVTLTEASTGTLVGDTATATAGVATFTGLTYTASADQENFTLSAAATGLTDIAASALTSDVVATLLAFSTEPAGSVSGAALTTQPVVMARDADGTTDTDFTQLVTLSEASAGSVTSNTATALAGVATFAGLTYTATADQQNFTLTAAGTGVTSGTASAVTSDVVATALAFTTQPAPLLVYSAQARALTTVPVVSAQDGNGVVDTGYSTAITLSETNGAGAAALSATDDSDASTSTVSLTPASGVSTFTGLQVVYSSAGTSDTFNLQASSGTLTTADSSQFGALLYDTDANVIAAAGVAEPVALNMTSDTVGEATSLFDFSLTDGAGGDALALGVSTVVLHVSGTTTDVDRAKVTWRLSGDDAANVTGVYDAASDTLTFSGLTISVADGATETYTLNAYFNDTSSLTHGSTVILSLDGDTDITESTSGTQITTTAALTNGTGTVFIDDLAATVSAVGLPADGTYQAGTNIDFTLTFSESVTVNTTSGTPRLSLTIGSTARTADYLSGSGSSTLVFRHTVQTVDLDSDGIALASTIDTNLGTIQDAQGNNASINLSAIGSLSAVLVDGIAASLAETTAVVALGNDSTPNVSFSTDEAGTLAVGGSCGSANEGAVTAGTQTITLTQADNETALAQGTYNDCTLTVTDAAGNASNVLALTEFVIDLTVPTVGTNTGLTLDEGATGNVTTTELSASDNVSAAANITYTLTSAATNGTLNNNGNALAIGGSFTQADLVNSLISYTHDGSETTSASFVFTVADQAGNINNDSGSNITFDFSVTAQNDAPVAVADNAATNEDTAVSVDVLANDSDADDGLNPASVAIVNAASNGLTSINTSTGAITYTPVANFNGADTFSYTVEDASGVASANTFVTVTVTAVNDAPVAVDDTANTDINTAVLVNVAANDSDVDTGDSLDTGSITVVSAATNGTAVVSAGQINYTPNTGYFGADAFTYTVNDSTGTTSNVATVNVTVIDNVAPQLTLVAAVTNVGTDSTPAYSFSTDEAGALVVTGSCGSASEGALAIGTHNIDLTQADNSTALADGTYTDCSLTVMDAAGNTSDALSIATFIVDTSAPTVSVNTGLSVDEGAAATVASTLLSVSDVNSGSTAITYTLTASSVNGSLSNNIAALSVGSSFTQADVENGLIGYAHDGSETTSDGFSFTLTDSLGNTSSASFAITVIPQNDAPVSVNDSSSTDEDTPVAIDVLANDSDVDDGLNPASVTIISAATNGSTTIDTATGAVTYTPNSNFNGTDNLSYTVQDMAGSTTLASSVVITVNAVNDAPTLVDDSASTAEDTPIVISVLANDSDVDSSIDVSSVSVVTEPVNGTTSIDTLTGDISYTPNGNFNGSDSFTYSVADTDGAASTPASVNVTVNGSGDAPITVIDETVTNEDEVVAIAVLSNDRDPDDATGVNGDQPESTINAASVTVVTPATNGTTSINTATGVITYSPSSNFNGDDSFTYTVEDASGIISPETQVTITVIEQNDAPLAVADVVNVTPGVSSNLDVAANDSDIDVGDTLDLTSVTIVTEPANGTTQLTDGVLAYTPNTDFVGSDSFTYTISDSEGAVSNTATVTLNVFDPANLPEAQADSATTDEDTAVVIDVLVNDSDPDGSLDLTSVTVNVAPNNGVTSVDAATGEVTYTPTANFNGTDTFSYTVRDDEGASSSLTLVTVVVNSVNDAPVLVGDVANLMEDNSFSINVLGNDSDVDGTIDPASVRVFTPPSSGSASVDSVTGAITYTPNANFSGTDQFTYRALDNEGAASNIVVVTVTVDAENDLPLANDDSASVVITRSTTINLIANDSDVDGTLDLATLTFIEFPLLGDVTDNGDGSVLYTTTSNAAANDSFTYSIDDNEGGVSNIASVTVAIVEPDAPVISGSPRGVVDDASLYQFMPAVTVHEGLQVSFSVTALPSWASFDTDTGTLSGEPEPADIGDYEGIVITVSDSFNQAALPEFSIRVVTSVDSDGDTISDGVEEFDGTDPNDINDFFDETPPLLNPPSQVIVDSTGLFTAVNLSVLLGPAEDATESEIQEIIDTLSIDNVDGTGCCNPQVSSMVDGRIQLPPGRNFLEWLSTDISGNEQVRIQQVDVRPLVSFGKNKTALEGETVNIKVVLNGPSPNFPLQVPYVIDVDNSTVDTSAASSDAPNSDHDLANGVAIFNEGQTEVLIPVNIQADDIAEGGKTLIIKLDDRTTDEEDLSDGLGTDIFDINAGVKSSFTLTIVERNIPPEAAFSVQQSGINTIQIANDGGPVTVTAVVDDPNPLDNFIAGGLSLDWSGSSNQLVDTDGDVANATFVFDPVGLDPGRYKVWMRVTDSEGAIDIVTIHLVLVESLPVLSPDEDSDGDGISDAEEGTADSDNDGIADFLDNIVPPNVIPEVVQDSDSFLIECEPGVRCRLGEFALVSASGGARMDEEDVMAQDDITEDIPFIPIGGIFDFEMHELQDPGQQVSIVVPQIAAIPADAVYRKFQDGQWRDFVVDDNNAIHSTQGNLGFCPPPGASGWQVGLIEGFFCVQLTIEDGGPN
ncbi:MAG: tandem-95 repeat protein, partial [Gammaproteobacteria bacterium]|nr:tandem-95 repeat protein [Gammaproteobacteria bacterium]